MATMGSLKIGTSAYKKEKIPKIAPVSRPTTGPSSAPPTMAGMCIIVALPMKGIGTGMNPKRVAPKNSATPPITPDMTISRVLKLNMDPPLFPLEFAAIFIPPFT
jgi:hypothetical protein